MFHHFLHRSFALYYFVADVQEMMNPVATAYSKVTPKEKFSHPLN
jgi:hypothetical protein